MSLRLKLILLSIASIAVTVGACVLIQRSVIRQQGIELTRDAMRGVLLSAENIRQSVSAMREAGIFAELRLPKSTKAGDYRTTKLYQTVPVVSAWRAIEQVSAKEGYQFRIIANQPRNTSNAPRPQDEKILAAFEKQGDNEYFLADSKANEIVYARPVRLTRDCLSCHGDPGSSPTKDGRDVLGFPMEDWKEGQVHGAFVLRASMDRLAPVTQAGMQKTLIWALPVGCIVGLIVFYIVSGINRKVDVVTQKLLQTSESVTASSEQIALASGSLARDASQQAASLEETSAASNEVKSMAARSAEHSLAAASVVGEVEESVHKGNKQVAEMIRSMDEINTASGKISQIIKTIDEIAFQTNILALNAAVEAARAGEAGMGFAVVADEVRALAQRCAQASRETSTLIEDSVQKARSGGAVAHNVAQVFQTITARSSEVRRLVEEITGACREQATGIDEVSGSLSQIDQLTQGTAANSEESAAAAAEMSTQAHTLRQIVAELQGLVKGSEVKA